MFTTTKENLISHLIDDLGLKKGDLVFLHPGIIGLGNIEGGINTITEAFSEVLAQGVWIIPTFSYSWCKGERYVPSETQCPSMGAYVKGAWKDKRFVRSLNPNFSVAALQNEYNKEIIKLLFQTAPTCFGKGSVFDNIYQLSHRLDGYIILFGGAHDDVIFRSTFVHYVEEKVGAPYRYLKKFSNPDNNNEFVTQLVRFMSLEEYCKVTGKISSEYDFPIKDDYTLLGKDLKENKLVKIKPFGYSQTRMVPIKAFCDFLEEKIKKNPHYCITKRYMSKV